MVVVSQSFVRFKQENVIKHARAARRLFKHTRASWNARGERCLLHGELNAIRASLRHAREALRGKRTRAPAAFSSSTRASSPRFVRERTRTMARYEQLVADDEIAARDAAHVDIVAQQERAKKRKLFREKIERLLWVLVSAFLVWFGDGTSNLGQIMLQRADDTRCAS